MNQQHFKRFEASINMPPIEEDFEGHYSFLELKNIYSEVMDRSIYNPHEHRLWNWFVLNNRILQTFYSKDKLQEKLRNNIVEIKYDFTVSVSCIISEALELYSKSFKDGLTGLFSILKALQQETAIFNIVSETDRETNSKVAKHFIYNDYVSDAGNFRPTEIHSRYLNIPKINNVFHHQSTHLEKIVEPYDETQFTPDTTDYQKILEMFKSLKNERSRLSTAKSTAECSSKSIHSISQKKFKEFRVSHIQGRDRIKRIKDIAEKTQVVELIRKGNDWNISQHSSQFPNPVNFRPQLHPTYLINYQNKANDIQMEYTSAILGRKNKGKRPSRKKTLNKNHRTSSIASIEHSRHSLSFIRSGNRRQSSTSQSKFSYDSQLAVRILELLQSKTHRLSE